MFSRFLQRRFSLMLALRYLNPLRTYFSVITLMCLLGVAIGIMVLIVALSVMNGLQQDIKSRFLAYTPHITISYYRGGVAKPTEEWREVVNAIKDVPGVESAYPQIEDYVLVDASGAQKPSSFRAIDTDNEYQMRDMADLVDPGGRSDLGLDDEAIISQNMARAMNIKVGDSIRVYAKRNYDGVITAFNRREHSIKKDEAEHLEVLGLLWKSAEEKNGLVWLDAPKVDASSAVWGDFLYNQYLRESEEKIISSVITLLDAPEKEEGGKKAYSRASVKEYNDWIEAIKNLNTDKEDLAAFESVKEVVLPRDLTVIGTYLSSKHVASPEIFIPINVGQELLGYEDPEQGGYWDVVQGIAIRAKDPYDLEPLRESILRHLPEPPHKEGMWYVSTWMNNPNMANWVDLMQQERVMVTFVLLFIMLVSAFCIMAVMFATSIQRKKEIAVMKALGARASQIIRVFLWQGVIIGVTGALMGVALAFLVLYFRVEILEFFELLNFRPFPTGFHGVNQIPYQINVKEIIMISIGSFFLVVFASIIPAVLTSRQDPAKSLRSV